MPVRNIQKRADTFGIAGASRAGVAPLAVDTTTHGGSSGGVLKFNPDGTIRIVAHVKVGDHMYLDTETDSKQIRINSRNFSQTSGSSIGFQSKPAQNVASTGSVIGGEVSPRANSGIAVANVIGLHVDAYLKGTAAGAISGDVRGLQVELVTDDAGTRTIGGDVSGIRMRMAFSSGTITGKVQAIKIEVPETQTNSKNYDAVFTLTSQNGLIWRDDYTTEVTTLAGAVKCLVNGSVRYIGLYSGAPVV